ncbi:hypothetical protein JR316_0000045 [Psilocybe cubensis]|uniref:Uncharacterized protein n=1 Tax=Psilocybe cubensis TaxID=181762 RepID=A0ACB8HDU7_PSICU|nr:hypothetical protein JR316_0000045 [Psilocybe cubensis]KAH9485983.1 hypothetical protein JR316_0000045 [Psilocybe cubensis]
MSYVGIVLIGPLGPFLTKRTEAISFVAVIHFINTPAKSVGHVSPSSLPRSFNQLIMVVDVERTFGALLIGGIVAFNLSGLVTAQAVAYFKRYPKDFRFLKLMSLNRFLDFLHTIFVSIALWDHLIVHFGDVSRIDFIPWSLGATVALTGILTIFVHIFFVHRIYLLSHGNFFVVIPMAMLSALRLSLAFLTTIKMIQIQSLSRFTHLWKWSFTFGLSLCSILDMLFAGLLCFFLRQNQKKNSSMNNIINSLMLYTFETGMVNCAASIATLICWVTMKDNLIFLGIHFAIGKLYANSVMATLNARKDLRQTGGRPSQFSGSGTNPQAIMYPDSFTVSKGSTVKIMVDQTKVSTFE